MSRTEKTNPFIVRLWDGSLTRVAHHDHATGSCDLPASVAEHLVNWNKTRCRWCMHDDGTRIGAAFQGDLAYIRADRKGERSRLHAGLGEELKAFRTDGEWND